MRERARVAAIPGGIARSTALAMAAAAALLLLAACGGDKAAKSPSPADATAGAPSVAPMPADGKRGADGGAAASGFGGGSGLDTLYGGYGGCPAPLTGVLNNGVIDAGLGGFKPSLLGGEFGLSGFGFMALQPCPGSGGTGGVTRAFESRWLHTSGIGLQVNQRESATPVTNTLTETQARFSANGFEYDISVIWNPVFANTTGGPADAPATGGGSSGSGGSAPGQPVPAPPTPVNTLPVIQAAVAQIAPGLPMGCFYREVRGDWADLAAMGIGDPRPAVPSGYTEAMEEIVRLVTPDAGCPSTPAPEGWPASRVSVHWGNGQRMLSADITSVPAGTTASAGRFGGGYGNWTTGKLQFYLSWDPAIGDAAARALAAALDPEFAKACVADIADMTGAQFAALGLSEPKPPQGYRLEGARQAFTTAPSAGCAGGGAAGFVAKWMFYSESVGGVIEAGVFSGPRPVEFASIPNIENQTLYWKDTKGREYYVAGFKADFAQKRADLVALAKSMDPAFDEKNLLPVPSNPGDPVAKPATTSQTGP